MKAILCPQYGPPEVLQFADVDKPIPVDNEVLVKILAASINTSDLTFTGGMARLFVGLGRPRDPRLGTDVAGRVETVGKAVDKFHPGDEVFGAANGSLAEYATTRQNSLVTKPANCTFAEAAALPVSAITALQGLRDHGQLKPGQEVLINGASGGVGTFAVQIAKWLGAEVTAVCSPRNVEQARNLGADHVIDYTRKDFTRSGQQYDLILAVNGYHPILAYRRVMKPQGIYVMVGASHDRLMSTMLQILILGSMVSRFGKQKMDFMGIAKINQKDLAILKELLEARKIVPVIERRYPLSQAIEALRYLNEGHARGKVVITTEADNLT